MSEITDSENDKTLADEMAEQDERFKAAIEQQEDIKETEKPEYESDLKVEHIEQYFIDEGQWLEGQGLADNSVYQRCPVCTNMTNIFTSLANLLEESLELLDKMRENKVDEKVVLDHMRHQRDWYITSKNISLTLFEAAHRPRNIINAHPELHSLAAAKRIQNAKNSKRKKDRKNRKNRRKNK